MRGEKRGLRAILMIVEPRDRVPKERLLGRVKEFRPTQRSRSFRCLSCDCLPLARFVRGWQRVVTTGDRLGFSRTFRYCFSRTAVPSPPRGGVAQPWPHFRKGRVFVSDGRTQASKRSRSSWPVLAILRGCSERYCRSGASLSQYRLKSDVPWPRPPVVLHVA